MIDVYVYMSPCACPLSGTPGLPQSTGSHVGLEAFQCPSDKHSTPELLLRIYPVSQENVTIDVYVYMSPCPCPLSGTPGLPQSTGPHVGLEAFHCPLD